MTSSRSTAQTERYRSTNAGDVRSSSRSRGRSIATGWTATTRVSGPADKTTTSSARAIASSRSWVTKTIVFFRCRERGESNRKERGERKVLLFSAFFAFSAVKPSAFSHRERKERREQQYFAL